MPMASAPIRRIWMPSGSRTSFSKQGGPSRKVRPFFCPWRWRDSGCFRFWGRSACRFSVVPVISAVPPVFPSFRSLRLLVSLGLRGLHTKMPRPVAAGAFYGQRAAVGFMRLRDRAVRPVRTGPVRSGIAGYSSRFSRKMLRWASSGLRRSSRSSSTSSSTRAATSG